MIRTSLIAELPVRAGANWLLHWLREVRMEQVGVFPFSPEEGTPAAAMTDRCDEEEAQRRADLIMDLQAQIMDDYNAGCIGKTMKVLCEASSKSGLRSGRTYADSPKIDGTVYFTGSVIPGHFAMLKITDEDGELSGDINRLKV